MAWALLITNSMAVQSHNEVIGKVPRFIYLPINIITMRITDRFGSIDPPFELMHRLNQLAMIAAIAKKLGLNDLFNQAYNAYHSLANNFDSQAREYCRKNSHHSWFGGSESYTYTSANDWNESYNNYTNIISDFDKFKLQKELMDLLNKVKQ